MQGDWKTRGRAHVYGHNIVHDNGMMEWKHIIERQTDPAILIPCLFKGIDPDFVGRVEPGDFVVAGRKFGTGKAHTTAYIALAALGVRILCESTFERVIAGAVNLGVPIMGKCDGITSVISTGDEVEIDMAAGDVVNLSTGKSYVYPPVPEGLRQILLDGGRKGFLQKWLTTHPELAQPLETHA